MKHIYRYDEIFSDRRFFIKWHLYDLKDDIVLCSSYSLRRISRAQDENYQGPMILNTIELKRFRNFYHNK